MALGKGKGGGATYHLPGRIRVGLSTSSLGSEDGTIAAIDTDDDEEDAAIAVYVIVGGGGDDEGGRRRSGEQEKEGRGSFWGHRRVLQYISPMYVLLVASVKSLSLFESTKF